MQKRSISVHAKRALHLRRRSRGLLIDWANLNAEVPAFNGRANSAETRRTALEFVTKYGDFFEISAYAFEIAYKELGSRGDWKSAFATAVSKTARTLSEAWEGRPRGYPEKLPKTLTFRGQTFQLEKNGRGKLVALEQNGKRWAPTDETLPRSLRNQVFGLLDRPRQMELYHRASRLMRIGLLNRELLRLRRPDFGELTEDHNAHELNPQQLYGDPLVLALRELSINPQHYRKCAVQHCRHPYFASGRELCCSRSCSVLLGREKALARYYALGGQRDKRRESNPNAKRRNRLRTKDLAKGNDQ